MGHLCVFLEEMFIQVLYSFLIGLLDFMLLSFKESLYPLNTGPLKDIYLKPILWAAFFTFFEMLFESQKINFDEVQLI